MFLSLLILLQLRVILLRLVRVYQISLFHPNQNPNLTLTYPNHPNGIYQLCSSFRGIEDEEETEESNRETVDIDQWMQWEHHEIFNWIMSLEHGLPEQYEHSLKEVLAKEQVKGTDLGNRSELKCFHSYIS